MCSQTNFCCTLSAEPSISQSVILFLCITVTEEDALLRRGRHLCVHYLRRAPQCPLDIGDLERQLRRAVVDLRPAVRVRLVASGEHKGAVGPTERTGARAHVSHWHEPCVLERRWQCGAWPMTSKLQVYTTGTPVACVRTSLRLSAAGSAVVRAALTPAQGGLRCHHGSAARRGGGWRDRPHQYGVGPPPPPPPPLPAEGPEAMA